MFLKKRNIVIEVSDENQEKIKNLLASGYNEYKRVVENDKKSNYKRQRI